jgi:hypothetical protein
VGKVLPGRLSSAFGKWVKEKVEKRIEDIFEAENVLISSRGLDKFTAKELSKGIVGGLIKGLKKVLTWHFPVWDPVFTIEVFPTGPPSIDDVIDPFKNPFVAVTRTG